MLSKYFSSRKPSAVRVAQLEFDKRKEAIPAINVAIGNVSLPMHPAMQQRMFELGAKKSPFKQGGVRYAPTRGVKETKQAFFNIIASSGFETTGLDAQITDGGSVAMEMVLLGTCDLGEAALLMEPAYGNYMALAARTGRRTVACRRFLQKDGSFVLPAIVEIEAAIKKYKPKAMIVIPYDNPTGSLYSQEEMVALARLCVKYNMWLVSDEAYRELFYTEDKAVSVWGLTDQEVPGIEGRRISIETASKVWNACGLRVGALVSDNKEFIEKCAAEYTANLCPNAIGQYIFGAIADLSKAELRKWYEEQRLYYKKMMASLYDEFYRLLPGIIVSKPAAALYSVVDVRNLVDENFQAMDFVMYCAREGKVKIEGKDYTLLVAPMSGFYKVAVGEKNPGRTQMRIAYVEAPEEIALVPRLFKELLKAYMLL
jgi:aspartate aminotransferase